MSSAAEHRVAVVGGSGFIGSHLVKRLESAGHPVLIVSRGSVPREALGRSSETALESVDIRSQAQISAALTKFRPATVYHLAAVADARESAAHMRSCMAVNAVGSLNVFEAAVEAGASLFVYGDSSKNYGNGPVPYRSDQGDAPICSYAVAKSAAWQLIQIAAAIHSISVCSIRPTAVFGPGQNFGLVQHVYDSARRKEPIRLQGGRQTRDFLYVRDAVEAFYRVMESPQAWGSAIPIGGGRELRIADWCREILEALESKVEVMEGAETARPTEIWRSYCDNSDALELLGWTPKYTFAQGIREMYGHGGLVRTLPASAAARAGG